MAHATVTSKGQITIPKSVRAELDLLPGDRIEFEVRDGAIVGRVRRVPDVMELFHRLPGIDRAEYDPDAEADALRRAAIAEDRTTLSE